MIILVLFLDYRNKILDILGLKSEICRLKTT